MSKTKPELVTLNSEAFRHLCIALGNDPARTAALRSRLETSRATCALFDTPRFVRNLESLYERMHARAMAGLPAAHLALDPTASR